MSFDQQSLAIETARNLAHTTKTIPYMVAVTPQYLLQLLTIEIGNGTEFFDTCRRGGLPTGMSTHVFSLYGVGFFRYCE